MLHIKATQIMICRFLPSIYIIYVTCFGYLAFVKTFKSEIGTKGKRSRKNGVLLGFEPRTLSTITVRLIRSATFRDPLIITMILIVF